MLLLRIYVNILLFYNRHFDFCYYYIISYVEEQMKMIFFKKNTMQYNINK